MGELLGLEGQLRLAGLALVGGEGGDVDEGLDVGVAGGGVGDDGAAVGVAGEDDRSGDGVEDAGEVGGVVGQAAQRVGDTDDRVPLAFEP